MVPVNYLAVVGGMAVMMVLGYVWYGPLFGKKWARLMGWSVEEMQSRMQKEMAKSYGIMALGAFLLSLVMSHSLIFAATYLGESGISAGLQTGFWNWLGFVVPVSIGTVLWDGKPWMLWFINAGYWLVGMCLVGILLALWV